MSSVEYNPQDIYPPLIAATLLYVLGIYCSINKRLFPYRNIPTPFTLYALFKTCTACSLNPSPVNSGANFMIGTYACDFALRLFAVATLSQPLKKKSEVDCPRSSILSFRQLLDTIDCILDMRGLDWDLGYGFYLPPDTRSSSSLSSFLVDSVILFLKYNLIWIVAYSLVLSIGTVSHPGGGTIFVWTRIPFPFGGIPVPPFITAFYATAFLGIVMYYMMEVEHLLLTFLIAPFYANPAKSWPVLYGNPLRATSVHDFWSHQWHGNFRYAFCATGGVLGWKIGGRVGAVLGVFLVSGILHDIGVWCMGQGTKPLYVTGYFLLQGIIVTLEKAFDVDIWIEFPDAKSSQKLALKASITRHKKGTRIIRKSSLVNNELGSLWTLFWVVTPGTLMIDLWTRRGVYALNSDVRAKLGL